jgi:hypothetical protein
VWWWAASPRGLVIKIYGPRDESGQLKSDGRVTIKRQLVPSISHQRSDQSHYVCLINSLSLNSLRVPSGRLPAPDAAVRRACRAQQRPRTIIIPLEERAGSTGPLGALETTL